MVQFHGALGQGGGSPLWTLPMTVRPIPYVLDASGVANGRSWRSETLVWWASFLALGYAGTQWVRRPGSAAPKASSWLASWRPTASGSC